jgi:hypothetical protein
MCQCADVQMGSRMITRLHKAHCNDMDQLIMHFIT